jgi:hypothetical protein
MSNIVRSPLEGTGGNIRVCIRVRPPNLREMALAGGVIVSIPEGVKGQVVVEGRPPFQLDVTFPTTVTQLECFEDVGVNIVQTACQGFNGARARVRTTAAAPGPRPAAATMFQWQNCPAG